MYTPLESFGVPEVVRAADAVSCRCGDDGCRLPFARAEDVVRWQAESPEANSDAALADE